MCQYTIFNISYFIFHIFNMFFSARKNKFIFIQNKYTISYNEEKLNLYKYESDGYYTNH